ncbi:hypothetical protein ALC56_04011 [Trachymyrmex septentrionalis]|uniref:Uncharacterized protein n=1 Tax=Trachymyrmex septentrionalis TaxID=34720 RepID=A0A151JYM7_9HYME|nr:hypothetical protein ALC56_04011 [Trachymyrmex septentrionalis]
MSKKVCVNDLDRFCYICGKYMLSKNLLSITDSLKERYYDYFHREIHIQDKIPSVTKPTLRFSMDSLPVLPKTGTSQENFQYEKQAINEDDNVMYDLETIPRLYDQAALNNLVRDLDLSKEKAELLDSREKA